MKLAIAIAIGCAFFGSMDSTANAAPSGTSQPAMTRDGQHDFDWEFGIWTTKVKVRRNRLSGTAPEWVDYKVRP